METSETPVPHAELQRAHALLMRNVEVCGSKYPLKPGIDIPALLQSAGIEDPDAVIGELQNRQLLRNGEVDGAQRMLVMETEPVEAKDGDAPPIGQPSEDRSSDLAAAGRESEQLLENLERPDVDVAVIGDLDNFRNIFAKAEIAFDPSRLMKLFRRRGRLLYHEFFCDVTIPSVQKLVADMVRAEFAIGHVQKLSGGRKDVVDQHLTVEAIARFGAEEFMPTVSEVVFCAEDQGYRPVLSALKNRGIRVVLVLPTPRNTSPLLDLADDIVYVYRKRIPHDDEVAVDYIRKRMYAPPDKTARRRIAMLAIMVDIMANVYLIDTYDHGFQALVSKLALEPELKRLGADDDEIASGLALLNGKNEGVNVLMRKKKDNDSPAAYRLNGHHAFIEAAEEIRRTL
ncbi:NYN domain-containing protein [Candidatus Uhrbacteria bacterium]|nr:NYN domain-containing protein [Candidatus Uhrbacteria bacterium]